MNNVYSQVLAFIKMSIFMMVVVTYFIVTTPFLPIIKFNPILGRKLVNPILSFFSRFCLMFMGINVEERKINIESQIKKGSLFVCNHLSYIDVLILASFYRASFVTSVEIKNTPFLGQLCQLGGCVFVERRNKVNLSNEVKEITESLANGINVVIFPEATSTNGDQVIRFRRPLYQSAIDSNSQIVPLTLNYKALSGKEVDITNRDEICWYDDMTFIDHLWGVFKNEYINAELTVNAPMAISQEDTVQTLSEKTHKVVSSYYRSLSARSEIIDNSVIGLQEHPKLANS
jgi:1-acyl-sn-glycerol-3-phosphate acyltransferase